MRFAELIKAIRQVDTGTKLETGKAINRLLTSRNWLIGWYIAVY